MKGALSQQTLRHLERFGPRDLVNTAWAFQTLAHCDAHLFAVIRDACNDHMNQFNAQDVANSA